MSTPRRPITLTLAALGGQGGGVVTSWLTEVARREGHLVQATSVPGVAQRTGATIYYLEFYPESALGPEGRRPIMALMPSPGDVDIVVASELVEAGRMIQRGLVTKRTTLIASTHRAFTIGEKISLGDARASSARILEEAVDSAKRCVAFDMAEVADRNGAIVSAVILGAVAGAAVLPFKADSYRAAIQAGGVAVERNLLAFDAAMTMTDAAMKPNAPALPALASGDDAKPKASAGMGAVPPALLQRLDRELPAGAREVARYGVARLVDYQDARYAGDFIDKLAPFAKLDKTRDSTDSHLTTSVARGLALWMSFEDTIRVADLKTRSERQQRVRTAARPRAGQIVEVTEFVKPRVQEICDSLPKGIGRRLLGSPAGVRWLSRFTQGRQIRTSTITGFAMLRLIAGMRRWRRGTYRFAQEHRRIADWLHEVEEAASRDYDLAVELANCQKLVRGYGETFERGLRHFELICEAARKLAGRAGSAAQLAGLRELATTDDRGEKLVAGLAAARL